VHVAGEGPGVLTDAVGDEIGGTNPQAMFALGRREPASADHPAHVHDAPLQRLGGLCRGEQRVRHSWLAVAELQRVPEDPADLLEKLSNHCVESDECGHR